VTIHALMNVFSVYESAPFISFACVWSSEMCVIIEFNVRLHQTIKHFNDEIFTMRCTQATNNELLLNSSLLNEMPSQLSMQ